jgi:predicted metal-dependent hydrolase
MKILIFILILIITSLSVYLYFHYTYPDMTYIISEIDNKFYLVRNTDDKMQAANMLAKIRRDVLKLSEFLEKNKNKGKYAEYKQYIELLYQKAPNIIFVESTQDSQYTSYSVNKGEQIVFCLRTKRTGNEMHDYNLVMYVVLHEISHVACPIYDNHGPLFRKIFAFLTQEAIDLDIYDKIDFNTKPEDYCGMLISDSII